jgi:hypothetical protein
MLKKSQIQNRVPFGAFGWPKQAKARFLSKVLPQQTVFNDLAKGFEQPDPTFAWFLRLSNSTRKPRLRR